jgi:hypothetical protein
MATLRANAVIPKEKAESVSKYVVGTKQAPKVIKQVPAAGTPVIAGMTIEIQTVSFSDVPIHVLDESIKQEIKNVPVATIDDIFETNDKFKNSVNKGEIPAEDLVFVTEELNRELAKRGSPGGLSPQDAQQLVKSFNEFGFEY